MSARSEIRPVKPDAGTWNAETLADGVTRISFRNSLWVLLSSDWHWDSVKCDRERLKADLELAKR